MDVFEEIRQRGDLLETARRYSGRIDKKGDGYYALCPFHQEDTPSLSIDREKGLWYCFGCQRGGDIIGFVAEAEGTDRTEAAQVLADRLGIEWSGSGGEETSRGRKLLERAQEIFRHNLTETSHGRKYRDYLRDRGISDELAETFGLGCTPKSSTGLVDQLLEEGFSKEDLVKFGLAGQNERGRYDFFRGRITFPLHDAMGNLAGFSGRVIDPDDSPKYINTKETPLYRKRRIIYNYHRARRSIPSEGAVVVEGFTDVIALHREGIENSVATSGTAFTEEHAERLARLTSDITLCFDGDQAGVRAAIGASKQCVSADVLPKVVLLGEDNDPDDIVSERGPEAFREVLTGWVDPVELIVRSKRSIEDRLERRRSLFEEAGEFCTATGDPILRDELVKRFAEEVDLPVERMRRELEVESDGQPATFHTPEVPSLRRSKSGAAVVEREEMLRKQEAELLAHLHLFSEYIDEEILGWLEKFELSDRGREILRLAIDDRGSELDRLMVDGDPLTRDFLELYHRYRLQLENTRLDEVKQDYEDLAGKLENLIITQQDLDPNDSRAHMYPESREEFREAMVYKEASKELNVKAVLFSMILRLYQDRLKQQIEADRNKVREYELDGDEEKSEELMDRVFKNTQALVRVRNYTVDKLGDISNFSAS